MMKWLMITHLTEEEIVKKFSFLWNAYRASGIGLFIIGAMLIWKGRH